MTECGLGSANPLDRPGQVRPGSAGPLVPGCEGKFVDVATGVELGPGEQGELWLRGPNVMSGYLGRPQETAATLVDGWLRTGDIGYADPDGWIYVVDRVKELIKYKAFQVAPAELEALLLTHPAVLDAAVIPSRHSVMPHPCPIRQPRRSLHACWMSSPSGAAPQMIRSTARSNLSTSGCLASANTIGGTMYSVRDRRSCTAPRKLPRSNRGKHTTVVWRQMLKLIKMTMP